MSRGASPGGRLAVHRERHRTPLCRSFGRRWISIALGSKGDGCRGSKGFLQSRPSWVRCRKAEEPRNHVCPPSGPCRRPKIQREAFSSLQKGIATSWVSQRETKQNTATGSKQPLSCNAEFLSRVLVGSPLWSVEEASAAAPATGLIGGLDDLQSPLRLSIPFMGGGDSKEPLPWPNLTSPRRHRPMRSGTPGAHRSWWPQRRRPEEPRPGMGHPAEPLKKALSLSPPRQVVTPSPGLCH